ncbi:MAG: DnaB-like helicase N-terminal domain-containing protein [Thermodesulfobacteriota bacterium]
MKLLDKKSTLYDEVREAEIKVLGSILIEPETLSTIRARLTFESFDYEAHRTIYVAMLELHDDGIPVDLLSLYDLLTERGEFEEVGGSMYLTYAVSLLVSEQVARDEEESGHILEWLRNGGVIKLDKGVIKYEN